MKRILGVGNALVDVIVQLPDESLLKSFDLPKGGMEMIDIERKRNLHAAISTMKQKLASGAPPRIPFTVWPGLAHRQVISERWEMMK